MLPIIQPDIGKGCRRLWRCGVTGVAWAFTVQAAPEPVREGRPREDEEGGCGCMGPDTCWLVGPGARDKGLQSRRQIQGRTDQTWYRCPMSQQAQSREGAKSIQDQGWFTRGRDFKLGCKDQLALVRHPGTQMQAPELHGHWGCREGPHVSKTTVPSKVSPAGRPGLQAAAPGIVTESPALQWQPVPGRGAQPWFVGGDLGEDPATFLTLSLHGPQEGE